MVTQEVEREVNKCAKCGKCRSICPVFLETGNESMVARGRISLAEALRNGEIFYTELLRDYLLSCKKCLRCSSICPSGVDYDLIIQTMLNDMAGHLGIWFIPRIIFRLFLTRRWLF
ncbi:MAG: (Fe-S)-binding protein, partial [Planctomycetes bacterium]|nr:(Fe-S)-binding protein [Planctomycetota bacterium]